MNKELKAKWIAALRSGRYTQGRGRLVATARGVVRYCCLGVLAEECGMIDQRDGYIEHMLKPSVGLKFYIPYSLGVSANDQGMLASMNDRGITFPEIADWIEENVDATA